MAAPATTVRSVTAKVSVAARDRADVCPGPYSAKRLLASLRPEASAEENSPCAGTPPVKLGAAIAHPLPGRPSPARSPRPAARFSAVPLRCPMVSILDAPDRSATLAWLRELA